MKLETLQLKRKELFELHEDDIIEELQILLTARYFSGLMKDDCELAIKNSDSLESTFHLAPEQNYGIIRALAILSSLINDDEETLKTLGINKV